MNAVVGAVSMIVKTDGSLAALINTLSMLIYKIYHDISICASNVCTAKASCKDWKVLYFSDSKSPVLHNNLSPGSGVLLGAGRGWAQAGGVSTEQPSALATQHYM